MKIIRATYRRDVSFGVLVIIFAVVYFLADQLFVKHHPRSGGLADLIVAKLLVSCAVIVMILIIWEEILFHVHIKPIEGGFVFRNHGTKLKFQVMIYMIIPVIIVFLYLSYEVSAFRFFSWAGVVAILPVVGKLLSGIKNYNDFLSLSPTSIQYKNNRLGGTYALTDISSIHLIRDGSDVLHQLSLELVTGEPVRISLDEMELHDYYESINEYVMKQYAGLIN